MALLELPKLYHSDFAIPGKQPSEEHAIDWDSEPLAQGLAIYPLLSTVTNNGSFNLAVPKNPGGYPGTPMTASPQRSTRFGRAVEFHPSGGPNGADGHTYDDIIDGTDITIYGDYVLENITAPNNRLWWRGSNTSTDSMRLSVTSSAITFTYIDSSPLAQHDATISGLSISIGDRVRVIGRKKGNVIQLFAKVGSSEAVLSSSETTGGSGNLRSDGTNVIHLTGPTNLGHTTIIQCCAWSKGLSAAEARTFLNDPYRVLRPEISPLHWFTSAPPGGLAIPIAMASYRRNRACF